MQTLNHRVRTSPNWANATRVKSHRHGKPSPDAPQIGSDGWPPEACFREAGCRLQARYEIESVDMSTFPQPAWDGSITAEEVGLHHMLLAPPACPVLPCRSDFACAELHCARNVEGSARIFKGRDTRQRRRPSAKPCHVQAQ